MKQATYFGEPLALSCNLVDQVGSKTYIRNNSSFFTMYCRGSDLHINMQNMEQKASSALNFVTEAEIWTSIKERFKKSHYWTLKLPSKVKLWITMW